MCKSQSPKAKKKKQETYNTTNRIIANTWKYQDQRQKEGIKATKQDLNEIKHRVRNAGNK